ncbi:biotin--[acetyl-CoA-carboxylase] ligase [Paracoccus sp. p4-l81]|uniref:biotin--[acetyl-CoA-carboxylase] ligase n=1 Tax=unclassified Paracoccus (in: a-proteobacteria) TaxID=2688777 RepID=UPI0035BB5378
MSADPDIWPEGVALHALGTVDSTMAEAARLAPHLTRPTWVLAERQTAGRGRRGRAWTDPPGNLAATLVLHPAGQPADVALYSFVAALAAFDALRDVAGPSARLAIKWPNDILLNDGKLVGILLEATGTPIPGQRPAIAIGFGINLEQAPPPSVIEPGAQPAVSLAGECGIRITPRDFITYLARAFDRWQARVTAEGFAPVREAWLARAARLGQQVRARLMSGEETGIFETIDPSGALILRRDDGRRVTIAAADVFFARPADAVGG